MNLNINNSAVQTFLVIGLVVLGLLILIVILRVISRASVVFEAISLLEEPLGDYLGNPRLVMLGCFVIVIMIVSCCALVFIVVGALLTCATSNPSGLCHIIGR